MKTRPAPVANIDEYIQTCREEIQPRLHEMRGLIRAAAPQASEKISWGMPTFVLHGNLVHFSAETRHMGFHPAPSAIVAFEPELAPYRYSKGTVQFPYDQPLPHDLISNMVRFRVEEQCKKEASRKNASNKTSSPSSRNAKDTI